MKVKLKIDPEVPDAVVAITASAKNTEVEQLYVWVKQKDTQAQMVEGFKDNRIFYLETSKILFFETDGRQVIAHTQDQAYVIKAKLYELEHRLGSDFMRISKSTILNLTQIYALTRSISDCQIQFQNTYKKVYVSRRYYHDLRQRLDQERHSHEN